MGYFLYHLEKITSPTLLNFIKIKFLCNIVFFIFQNSVPRTANSQSIECYRITFTKIYQENRKLYKYISCIFVWLYDLYTGVTSNYRTIQSTRVLKEYSKPIYSKTQAWNEKNFYFSLVPSRRITSTWLRRVKIASVPSLR